MSLEDLIKYKEASKGQKRKHYSVDCKDVFVDFSPYDKDVFGKVQAKAIKKALAMCGNNKTKAGHLLGISSRSIRYHLDKLSKEAANEDLSNKKS